MAELLGTLFSDPAAPITPEAEALALRAHLGPLFYWFSIQRNVPVSEALKQAFTSASALQMVHESALKKLFRSLEQAQIPFVPIKGVDLAFRVYPVPALRLFCDWDILIRESGHKKLISLLQEDGWVCPSDHCGDYHWGDWNKGRFLLEPHFSLPNFSGVPVPELWEIIDASAPSGMQRSLPAELNLIMLYLHTIGGTRHQRRLLKLLIDTEFLLRSETVDWRRISDFVRKWHLPHPGVLLDAFPEFFRDRRKTGIIFPPEQVSALRTLLLSGITTLEQRRVRVFAEDWMSFRWFRKRLMGFTRASLRLNYPEMGPGKIAYLRCLCLDIFCKAMLLRQGFSAETRAWGQKKKLIERSWQEFKMNDAEGTDCEKH